MPVLLRKYCSVLFPKNDFLSIFTNHDAVSTDILSLWQGMCRVFAYTFGPHPRPANHLDVVKCELDPLCSVVAASCLSILHGQRVDVNFCLATDAQPPPSFCDLEFDRVTWSGFKPPAVQNGQLALKLRILGKLKKQARLSLAELALSLGWRTDICSWCLGGGICRRGPAAKDNWSWNITPDFLAARRTTEFSM